METMLFSLRVSRDTKQYCLDDALDRLDNAMGEKVLYLQRRIDGLCDQIKRLDYCIFIAERINDLHNSVTACTATIKALRGNECRYADHYINTQKRLIRDKARRKSLFSHLSRVLIYEEEPDHKRQLRMMQFDFLRAEHRWLEQGMNGYAN